MDLALPYYVLVVSIVRACVENKVRVVRRPRLPMQVIWDRAGSVDTMDGDDLQPRVFDISTIAM